MPYSSTFGPSRGAGRAGRWFVLVFLCVALVLVLVPAVSLGHATSKWMNQQTKVTLSASRTCVQSGDSVKLTAKASPCPSGATFTLLSKGSSGTWTTVAASPAGKCGTVVFKVTPIRNTSYEVTVLWSHGSVTSKPVCVKVKAKLTLCVKPAMYGALAISGTLVPGWTGGNVTITIDRVFRGCKTQRVAMLIVALTPGVGDSSVFATNWTALGHNTYIITVKVANTANFCGACASKVVKL